ncbi:hypothetical protein [Lapillicoccus jejuensis]|uniref:hypothetical protein n=1 Tax=Lapillicoccus jejuensis TaxID=402171 RepID=UPI00114F002C
MDDVFAMDPAGVRRAGDGLEGPSRTARAVAARLQGATVPRGAPDLSAGAEIGAFLDVEADGLRSLAVELGLLRDAADAGAASVAAADAAAAQRFARPTSAALREALG